MRLEDLPPHLQDQARAQLAAGAKAVPPPNAPADHVPTGQQKRDEKQLQNACERWLTLHGYRRRTPDDIAADDGLCRGYFVHLHDAKRNPILGDLLILHKNGRYLEIELKTATGKLTAEQGDLEATGWITVCRSLVQFIELLESEIPKHPTLEQE